MEQNAFPNGGTGDVAYRYTPSYHYQKKMQDFLQETIVKSIVEKFDMKTLMITRLSSMNNSSTIRIADLGCAVGPNTLISMKNVVEALERKLLSQKLDPKNNEFHVFFNDLSSNDFNTLFTSLPPDRHYFAAGVPGSFYGRLFPNASLDFVLSSYTLMCLSKVPEGINSPSTCNKGRVSYSNSSKQVFDAYAAQYAKDMGAFLSARADEIAVGGMMIIFSTTASPGGPHGSQHPGRLSFSCLEQSLVEMIKLGLISEAQVDSFNLPFYAVSPDEVRGLVERNGCFDIERMELIALRSKYDSPSLEAVTRDFRPGFEALLTAHFGTEVIDQVFDRTLSKVAEVYPDMASNYKRTTDLFLVLKRT